MVLWPFFASVDFLAFNFFAVQPRVNMAVRIKESPVTIRLYMHLIGVRVRSTNTSADLATTEKVMMEKAQTVHDYFINIVGGSEDEWKTANKAFYTQEHNKFRYLPAYARCDDRVK